MADPGATPVTIPELPTIAIVVLLLTQDPPPGLDNAIVLPTQAIDEPVIGVGNGFIVTVVVAPQPARV